MVVSERKVPIMLVNLLEVDERKYKATMRPSATLKSRLEGLRSRCVMAPDASSCR